MPLGSYTDAEGYTVTVQAYEGAAHVCGTRRGKFRIRHPGGTETAAGYWMDYPEDGWFLDGVDLRKDHEEHLGREAQSYWRSAVPLQVRLDWEAKEQATAYKPLKEQFVWWTSLEGMEWSHSHAA